jgi:uracil-DNA glycosylase family 4
MPVPIQEPQPIKVEELCDYRLALNIDDVFRMTPDARKQLLAGRINFGQLASKMYIKVDGRAEPEAAIEFSCPLVEAATVCDVIRHQDAQVGDKPSRVYVNRRDAWTRLPAEATLTTTVDGGCALNREVFDVKVEAAAAEAPEDYSGTLSQFERSSTNHWIPNRVDEGVEATEDRCETEQERDISSDVQIYGDSGTTETFDREDQLEASSDLGFGEVAGAELPEGVWYDPVNGLPAPAGAKPKRIVTKRTVALSTFAPPIAQTFAEHHARWKDCQLCPLGKQRSEIVLARGKLPCDVAFVGEAPRESEDAMGVPFVGPAGQLLDRIEAKAFTDYGHLRRAFFNMVACFPREAKAIGIHVPDGEEVMACAERLREMVHISKPRLIVFVGSFAEKWFPKSCPGYDGQTAHMLHPAAILKMLPMKQPLEAQRCVVGIVAALRKLT